MCLKANHPFLCDITSKRFRAHLRPQAAIGTDANTAVSYLNSQLVSGLKF